MIPAMSLTLCMQQNEKTTIDKSGVEYTVHGNRLVKCNNTALKCYYVKPGIRYINDDAFENCNRLQQVELPKTVIHIGAWAFYRCQALENIVVPASVTTIGDYAFSNCKSLKSILLVGKVKSIGEYAFLSCDALKSIVIPRGTKAIYQTIIPECYWPLMKDTLSKNT
jgi:hypothetical protein